MSTATCRLNYQGASKDVVNELKNNENDLLNNPIQPQRRKRESISNENDQKLNHLSGWLLNYFLKLKLSELLIS